MSGELAVMEGVSGDIEVRREPAIVLAEAKKAAMANVKSMYKDYIAGMTLMEVSQKYGFKSNSTVLYHFQRNNLKTRRRGGAIKQSQIKEDKQHGQQ